MKYLLIIFFIVSLFSLTGCDDGYDMDKYMKYKENGELSDAVHEWIGDYVERYCSSNSDGSISCR